jgi:hypothetical protein
MIWLLGSQLEILKLPGSSSKKEDDTFPVLSLNTKIAISAALVTGFST